MPLARPIVTRATRVRNRTAPAARRRPWLALPLLAALAALGCASQTKGERAPDAAPERVALFGASSWEGEVGERLDVWYDGTVDWHRYEGEDGHLELKVQRVANDYGGHRVLVFVKLRNQFPGKMRIRGETIRLRRGPVDLAARTRQWIFSSGGSDPEIGAGHSDELVWEFRFGRTPKAGEYTLEIGEIRVHPATDPLPGMFIVPVGVPGVVADPAG